MQLLKLPPELLLQLGECMPLHDLNSLAQCSKSLYNQLNVVLYRGDGRGHRAAWGYAVTADCIGTLRCIDESGISFADCPGLLHYAVRWKRPYIVRYVLDTGDVGVDFLGDLTYTPLTRAALEGHKDIVRLLLDYGADPSAYHVSHAGSGHTPLAAAMLEGYEGVAVMLVQAGADISVDMSNGRNASRPSPLVWAAKFGMSLLTELLLDMGADSTDHRSELLHHAVHGGDFPQLVKLLLDRGFTAPEAELYEMLVHAVDGGMTDVVELLLDHGADAEYHTRGQSYPCPPGRILVSPVRYGYLKTVQLLLRRGISPHFRDRDGRTAMHLLNESHESEDIATALLDAGADPCVKDSCGLQPIHTARAGACKVLLSRGADLNATSDQGETPLHRDVGYDKTQLLLWEGADANARDILGQTPLMRACRHRDAGVLVTLLVSEGADVRLSDSRGHTALMFAIENSSTQAVDSLIDAGAKIDFLTASRGSALILAVLFGSTPAMVRHLLSEASVDATHRDIYGRTALHYAAREPFDESLNIIINHHPECVLVKDHWGATALTMALRNGHEKATRRLLQAHDGQDPTGILLLEEDIYGYTAADWAEKIGVPLRSTGEYEELRDQTLLRDQPFCWTCGRCTLFKQLSRVPKQCEKCAPNGRTHLSHRFRICHVCEDAGIRCLDESHDWIDADIHDA